MVRIALDANVMNPGIGFHRIDVLGAQPERNRHIIAGARTDDEHAGRDRPPVLVRKAVDRDLVEPSLCQVDRLMRDPVDEERDGTRRVRIQANFVVRRPAVGRDHRLEAKNGEHGGERRRLPERAPAVDQEDKRTRDDRSPDEWGCLQKGERRKGDDPGQAAKDVQPVGLKRREAAKGPCHPLPYQRHHAGDPEKEQRQSEVRWQPASCAQRTEENQLGTGSIDFDGEQANKRDQRRKRDRGEHEEITSGVGSEESETDAEEAGEQDEVREIRQVKDVRADPSDQGQLQKEHQETERDQPDALRLSP